MYTGQKPADHKQVITPEMLKKIAELANSVHYGSINLVIQDGALVQIEKNEKIRVLSNNRD